MNFNYQLADFVTRLKMSFYRRKVLATVNYNKLNLRILEIFLEQGCIRNFYVKYDRVRRMLFINVGLKYENNLSVIRNIKIISTPGLRIFLTRNGLAKLLNKNTFQGFYILSTSDGLCTSNDLLLSRITDSKISGEVLLKIEF